MDIKLLKVLKNINQNDVVLNLLKCKVITLDYVVDLAISSGNAGIIYEVGEYIKKIDDDLLVSFVEYNYEDTTCKLDYDVFATSEKNKIFNKLLEAIINTEENRYIFLFYNNIIEKKYDKNMELIKLKEMQNKIFTEMVYDALNGDYDQIKENRKLYQNVINSFAGNKVKCRTRVKEDNN